MKNKKILKQISSTVAILAFLITGINPVWADQPSQYAEISNKNIREKPALAFQEEQPVAAPSATVTDTLQFVANDMPLKKADSSKGLRQLRRKDDNLPTQSPVPVVNPPDHSGATPFDILPNPGHFDGTIVSFPQDRPVPTPFDILPNPGHFDGTIVSFPQDRPVPTPFDILPNPGHFDGTIVSFPQDRPVPTPFDILPNPGHFDGTIISYAQTPHSSLFFLLQRLLKPWSR